MEAESGSKLRDPWRRHWRPEVPTLLPVLMVKMSLIVPVFPQITGVVSGVGFLPSTVPLVPVVSTKEMVDTINLQYPPEIVQYYSPNYARVLSTRKPNVVLRPNTVNFWVLN